MNIHWLICVDHKRHHVDSRPLDHRPADSKQPRKQNPYRALTLFSFSCTFTPTLKANLTFPSCYQLKCLGFGLLPPPQMKHSLQPAKQFLKTLMLPHQTLTSAPPLTMIFPPPLPALPQIPLTFTPLNPTHSLLHPFQPLLSPQHLLPPNPPRLIFVPCVK